MNILPGTLLEIINKKTGVVTICNILIDLLIIALTTGITYYCFSILPAKKRKKQLKKRLKIFREALNENILEHEEEFKSTYELYKEENRVQKKNGEEIEHWRLIKIKNWKIFFGHFRHMLLMDYYFKNYWQGKELIFLVNSLIMDDPEFIDLSIKVSELDAHIHIVKRMGDNEKIWRVKKESELIPSKIDNEVISMIVEEMEDVCKATKELVSVIDSISK